MNVPENAANTRRRRPKVNNSAAGTGASSSDQYLSKAINRALDVLELFPDGETMLGLKEISQNTEMPEASLFRALVTLETRGYLSQNEDGSYRLTSKVLLGKLQESAQAFQAVARPKMQALARRFDETTSIAYLFSDHVRVLDSIESYQDIRAINKIGRILPPYASSMGKAITAFQSRQLIDRLVEVYGLFRRTEHTNTDRNTIFAEFERIRKDGYAYDRGEAMDGGLCTGAPIFFPNGRVEASISVSVPLIRMNTEREKEILAAILRASQEISVALKAS